MPHEVSRKILVEGRGTQFDPQVIDAFLSAEAAFKATSIRQQFLNDADVTSDFQRRAQLVADQAPEPSPVGVLAESV